MAQSSKKIDKKEWTVFVEAAIIITIGVLFCFKISLGQVLSTIIGVALIVAGAIFLTISIATKRSTLSPEALGGAAMIGAGILFIVNDIVSFVFGLTPYLMITFGSIVIADAFLGAFARKEGQWGLFVLKLIIGDAVLALGICLLAIPEFATYVGIILGIALIILGIYLIVVTLAAKHSTKKAKA